VKLAKATIYYYSHEGKPTKSLHELLSLKDWIYYDLFDIEEVEIGEWYDQIDLNKITANKETYENYFESHTKAMISIVSDTVRLMEVSDITGMKLKEAVDKVCKNYLNNGNNDKPVRILLEGDISLITERCRMILEY
jgi:hypothetical protein